MKSFKSYLKEYGGYGVDAPAFAVGGASTGPGMGQYVPTADLNLRASRAKQAVNSRGKVARYVTAHNLKFKGKQYKEIDMELVKIDNSKEMVTFKIIGPKELFGNETNISFRALRRGPFMATKIPNAFEEKNPRIPRKKGQPAGSDKHSDLYTDENPRGTIHGLKFATVKDAEDSVRKIKNSGKKHAHKIQAAIAMEQRAREMGKISAADVYREYINKMKKKTKEMQKEDFLMTEKFGVIANQAKLSEVIFRGSVKAKESVEVDNMYIPMSGAMFKRIFPKQVRVRTFHVTSPEGFENLYDIQNSSKSVSTFAYMSSRNISQGIAEGSGVVAELDGNALISSSEDLFSVPIVDGRRLISYGWLRGPWKTNDLKKMDKDMAILLKALIRKYAPERAKKRTSPYFTDFEVWKSVHASYMHYKNDSDKKVQREAGKRMQKIIKDYLDGVERVLKKNAEQVQEILTRYLKRRETDNNWDEIVVDDFNIVKVFIISDHEETKIFKKDQLDHEEYKLMLDYTKLPVEIIDSVAMEKYVIGVAEKEAKLFKEEKYDVDYEKKYTKGRIANLGNNQYRVLDVEADNEKDAVKKAIKIADTAKIGRITPRDVFKVSKPYDEEVELDELRVTSTTTKKLKMYYDKFKKAVTPREKSILSNIVRELKKRGIPLTAQYEERNYKKEYANYQGKPEQIARRSSRNKARRLMGDKVVKGMDVGHKDNNPLNNDPKNLKMEDPSKNRREPRLREDKEDDELQKTMKVATAKVNLAKRIKQTRTQQKNRMDTLIRQKAPSERKKQLKRNQDAQIKQIKTDGATEIKSIMKSSLWERFTQSDVVGLEKFADRILKKYKIDVSFTKHFVDRLNDPRNDPEIKVAELQRFFKKIQRNKGIGILSSPDIEAVLKDMETNLNLPVVIKKKGNEFEVLNKTIMRKPDFKTTSKVIRYENAPDTKDAMKRYRAGKAGFTDIAHLKAKGLIKRADGTKKKSAKYEDTKCPPGYKFDKKLGACVPKGKIAYAYPFFVGNRKSDDTDNNQQPSNGNGNGANGQNGAQTSNGQASNGQTGEMYIAADVRKMPDGGYGVYADVFKKGKRVMTPGGKHKKELKKVYKNEKDANDYMAAIMIAKGGG